jgi:hypothetical protein
LVQEARGFGPCCVDGPASQIGFGATPQFVVVVEQGRIGLHREVPSSLPSPMQDDLVDERLRGGTGMSNVRVGVGVLDGL